MDKAAPSLTGFFERHPRLALPAKWAKRAKLVDPYFPFILLLYAVALYYMATLTLLNGDTDLWYHLSGGRYFFEHGGFADTSFFSFLWPPRTRVDYFWLFQVIVYKTYALLGNGGLYALRSVLFISLTIVVLVFLRSGKSGPSPGFGYSTLIFTVFFLILSSRSMSLRPHCFSYLFAVATLYILEVKRRWAFLLPALSMLWSNVHGIEYPVMLAIHGAYLVEVYAARAVRGSSFSRGELLTLASVGASMLAVYVNPHGSGLLGVPFIDTGYASKYIFELRPLQLSDFFTFSLGFQSFDWFSLVNVLVVVTAASFVCGLVNGRLKISHALLLAAGVFLLLRGHRFIYEFSLLCLPILRANPPLAQVAGNGRPHIPHTPIMQRTSLMSNIPNIAHILPKPVFVAVSIFLMAFSLAFVRHELSTLPVSPSLLPHGTVNFLKHVRAGGSVMNHPNEGGYLQWELGEDYKIFMDMEVPHLFTDEDMYTILNAYGNPAVLEHFICTYRPAFILVHIKNTAFKGLIAGYPQYVPVFFDDVYVLFADGKQYPAIAGTYALKSIDPFGLVGLDVYSVKPDDSHAMQAELKKMYAIDPYIGIVDQAMGMLLKSEGKYSESIPYLDRFIRVAPEESKGYLLKGEALIGLKKYSEALAMLKSALEKSNTLGKPDIYRNLWLCYSRLNKPKEAYGALGKAVDMFAPETSYVDLYNLGLLASAAGKSGESEMLFKFAYQKVPTGQREWKERIARYLPGHGK